MVLWTILVGCGSPSPAMPTDPCAGVTPSPEEVPLPAVYAIEDRKGVLVGHLFIPKGDGTPRLRPTAGTDESVTHALERRVRELGNGPVSLAATVERMNGTTRETYGCPYTVNRADTGYAHAYSRVLHGRVYGGIRLRLNALQPPPPELLSDFGAAPANVAPDAD